MMDTAKVVRIASESEGSKGEALAMALQQGILSVDAQREYADMLKRYDILEHQKAQLEREIEYLQGCLGVEQVSNRRMRNIYRNALADKQEQLFKPTKTEKLMSVAFAGIMGAIVTLTVMLGYLIVKYCL